MSVEDRDTEDFHKVLQNLTKFSENVSSTINTFSDLFSKVFRVPLSDHGIVLKLKMDEKIYKDDFASHLKHLRLMCATLEAADESPITLNKLKKNIGQSFYQGKMALGKVKAIESEVIQKSIQQISALKDLATEFKKIKEDEKTAFETPGKEKEGATGLGKAILSKLRGFLTEEARRALFESSLETDPDTLLTQLQNIERSLQETHKVTSAYQEALQTVNDRMKGLKGEIKQEGSVDVIVSYVSGIKGKARKIAEECDRIKAGQK